MEAGPTGNARRAPPVARPEANGRKRIVIVILIVIVVVVAPLIVAALVIGNAPVVLAEAVAERHRDAALAIARA